MRIDSSGDLTVKGGRIFVNESDNGNTAIGLTRDADEGYVQVYSAGSITTSIRGNGASYFNGGNVGIGVTPDGSDWNASSTLLHLYQNSTNGALLKLESSNTSVVMAAGNNQLQLGTIEAQPFNFYTSGTERMRISSDGDLELIQSKNLYWKHQGGGTIRAGITADSSDNLTFSTGSSDTTRMTIDGSGQLTNTSDTTALAASFLNTNTSGYGMRVTTYSNATQYGLAVDSYGGGYSRDFTVGVDGNVNVLTGNLVIGTAGKGIDFSATANGSGTTSSELLDDYEEGTWTPNIGSGASGGTFNHRQGFYRKVGRVVHFEFDISPTGWTANGDHFYISDLPFTSLNTVYAYGFGVINYQTQFLSDALTGEVSLHVGSGLTTLKLYYADGNPLPGNAATVNQRLIVSGRYFTA
jgi:hypothetical protein